MQVIQELEAERLLSADNRDKLLLGFLESIERINKHIAWHESFDEPSAASLREFNDLRASCIEQIKQLMKHYGLDVKLLPVSSDQGSKTV